MYFLYRSPLFFVLIAVAKTHMLPKINVAATKLAPEKPSIAAIRKTRLNPASTYDIAAIDLQHLIVAPLSSLSFLASRTTPIGQKTMNATTTQNQGIFFLCVVVITPSIKMGLTVQSATL
jgi:hypothetical protein